MRIVIDKDVSEIQLLQESWEKSKPTYKVVATNESDEFVYAKGLKKVTEEVNAVYDVAWDSKFDDCKTKIVEVVGESENVIWSSDPKVQVCESVLVKEADEQQQGGDQNGGGDQGGGNNGGGDKNGDTSAKDAKTGQNKKGFFGKLKDAAGKLGDATKKALGGLAKGLNIIGVMTKQFSKDVLMK